LIKFIDFIKYFIATSKGMLSILGHAWSLQFEMVY